MLRAAPLAAALALATSCWRGQHLRATYPDARPAGGPCEDVCRQEFYRRTRYKNLLEVTSCRTVRSADGPQADCDLIWDWVGN